MTKIYLAMEDELLVVGRREGHWHADRQLAGSSPRCVAADPLRPDHLYCGTADRGLWRSADAGASWERVGEGVIHDMVMAVAVGLAERADGLGIVYAGTEPSTLFRSEDGGESWEELWEMRELPSASEWSFPPKPETSHVRFILPDPHVAGNLFVCIEAGALIRSHDGGRTWRDRTPDGPRDTHTLAAHKDAPGRLYSAAGDGFMRAGMGYAESRDGGEAWERFFEGLKHHYLWGVAVDPADSEMVLVSAAASPREAHNPRRADSTIYRKEAGRPWQEVTDGLPETRGRVASVLASNEDEPGAFYALTNLGLYRSPDAGLSWESLDIAWPDHYRDQRQHGLAIVGAG